MARKRERGTVSLVGVARRTRSALMVSTALQAVVVMVLAVPAAAQPAPNAQPTGGVVVGGAVSINQNATSTNINQATQRGAINWRGFDVGSQQSVNFQQPNAQAITLNTVTGPNPSQIAGKINANGQVVLVNQSGVTFYRGSQVNTAGLMVSAAATDPAKFMAGGKIVFDRPGDPNARIINNGNITISGAGLAGLVAPSVANAGVIDAKLGHVVLAGAKTATLDLYGDKLVSLNVTGAVTKAPDGVDALVTNTGVIRADGGTVRLTARAVDGVVTNLVSAGGTVQARSIGDKQGRITIDGVGGSITITGNLDASGSAPGTVGGKIGLLASDSVIVKSGATVNASGVAGGGVVAVGTTLKRAAGGPSVTGARTAKNVLIEHGATLSASATGGAGTGSASTGNGSRGNGGRVTLLSSEHTSMDGTILATGAPAGGNGGFVEVSGKYLGITGVVDVSAPNGLAGTILLDPDFLTIVGTGKGGTEDPNFLTNNGTVKAGDGLTGAPDTISNTVINSFLGDVLLQANKVLTVSGTIDLTANKGVNQQLVLEAGGTIAINAAVTASGDIILATGGAGPGTVPTAQTAPLIALGAAVTSNNGSVSLLAGPTGTINIAATGTVSAPTSGKLITLQADTIVATTGAQISAATGTVEIAPASSAEIHLGGTSGLTLSQSVLSVVAANTLRLGGATINGSLVRTATSISIDGAISLAGIAPVLDLQTAGAVTQTAALTNVGTLTGSAGSVTLTNTGNLIGGTGDFTATSGDFNLTSGDAIGVNGTLSATSGNVVLRSIASASTTAVSSIAVSQSAVINAAATGTVSARADRFTVATGGTVTGGLFEFTRDTSGTLTLGS
jgi:filamentous hemagglutinin family protein